MNNLQKGLVYLTTLATLSCFNGCSRENIVEKPFEVKGKVISKEFNKCFFSTEFDDPCSIEYLISVNQDSAGEDTVYLFKTYHERARKFKRDINDGDNVSLKSEGYIKSPNENTLKTRYASMWKKK